MTRTRLATAVFAGAGLLLAGMTLRPTVADPQMPAMPPMPGMGMGAMVPPVKGYAEGQEILFAHTEASDPKVAQMLTQMMNSPVLVVPTLAQVPDKLLGNVYVFTNGVVGGGPLGFQPDVFDRPAGAEGYTPLRALNRVTWKNEQFTRVLKSVAEINDAVTRDEVMIDRPGVVINMPMLTWPGGHR